jgi:hypothetical protein
MLSNLTAWELKIKAIYGKREKCFKPEFLIYEII